MCIMSIMFHSHVPYIYVQEGLQPAAEGIADGTQSAKGAAKDAVKRASDAVPQPGEAKDTTKAFPSFFA